MPKCGRFPSAHRVWVRYTRAYDRFVRAIKQECLDKFVPFGEHHLQIAIEAFMAHYHAEQPRQGVGSAPLTVSPSESPNDGEFQCKQRLGGLLKDYYRQAA